ncbi:hypothetical protein GLOIN_2v1482562 [Rhizophagus irregularis DAOM 181602=DAOM 197198]|nr:hypothetical protein GLOIN_2v1482562 [Rhizophagus irregularis DAOM 181602=DAOM 197198]
MSTMSEMSLSEFIKEYAGLLVEIIEICALTIPLSSLNGPTHFRVTAELRRRSGCQLTSCLNGFPAWSYHDRVNQNVPDIGLL